MGKDVVSGLMISDLRFMGFWRHFPPRQHQMMWKFASNPIKSDSYCVESAYIRDACRSDGMSRAVHVAGFVRCNCRYIFLPTLLQTLNTFTCLSYIMFLGIWILCILPVLSDLTVDTSFCPICRQRSYKHKTHLSAPYVMFLGVFCNTLSFTRPFNLPR